MKDVPHVIVIGGGGTGVVTACDLALCSLRVILLERGEIISGTAGWHHGLFHQGGRWHGSQRVVDAVLGRYPERPCHPANGSRDDGAGRSLRGRVD